MTCQEHTKCPNCGGKLFLCECRGPHLEGSSAVQWDEERLGHSKFVVVRSSSSYNTGQQVGRETCCSPSDSVAIPTLLWGRQGSGKSFARSTSKKTGTVLPGVNQCSTPDRMLICTGHCSVCRTVPVVNPILSAGFPVSSHYRCSSLTK